MNFKTFKCPNCAANYNPAKYQCEYELPQHVRTVQKHPYVGNI